MTEHMRVLITVKAAPEPSKTYIDTVCVAGVRVDQQPSEWIRLYPVPFRHLDSSAKFAKFQVIEVDVNRSPKDSRPESRRPVWATLDTVGDALPIPARAAVLEPLQRKSMCQLRADVLIDPNAQSLGLVAVRSLERLEFERHPGWTEQQHAALDASMQPTLFDEPGAKHPPRLEPPRLRVFYRYRCIDEACRGHRQSILDFEMSALQYRNRHASDETLRRSVIQKFQVEKFGPDKRTSLFVGNIADPTKRRSFSTLGVFVVPAHADYGSTLF